MIRWRSESEQRNYSTKLVEALRQVRRNSSSLLSSAKLSSSSVGRHRVTVCFFVTGASLLAAGIHLSYANVGPQQARAKARSDFVKQRLRKLLDD
ncbi:hypothetical protein SO802_030844 [Lithocarpus litseifolius]|uniref:Transmembrane protein n=1 Tax=Lithocarpus litseifolius TaxID=425828 RepID=A0AAW2BKE5_9ROSI